MAKQTKAEIIEEKRKELEELEMEPDEAPMAPVMDEVLKVQKFLLSLRQKLTVIFIGVAFSSAALLFIVFWIMFA